MSDYTINSLCEVLDFSDKHGFCPTFMSHVSFFRASQHEASCPQKYESGLIFILQGYKIGYANGQNFKNGKGSFLILTNSYPILCETFASTNEPLLGLYVHFNFSELSKLSDIIERSHQFLNNNLHNQAVVSCKMTDEIENALQYLIETLHNQVSSQALEKSCLSRLYYSVLTSPYGSVLRNLSKSDSNLAKISAAMKFMEENLKRKLTVEDISSHVNLSVPSFHRIFKEMTDETPLQYLKKIRLTKAKNLIVYHKKPAYIAAIDVGYESPNQFSREFKRYFGVPPKQAVNLPYSSMVGVE